MNKLRCREREGPDLRSLLITIRVGEEHNDGTAEFFASRSLLVENSLFFAKMLDPKWKEGDEGVVKLPTVEPEIFEIYLRWLYTRKMYTNQKKDDVIEEQGRQSQTQSTLGPVKPKGQAKKEHANLLKCFQLGDMLQDVDFQDVVIDTILEQTQETINKDKRGYNPDLNQDLKLITAMLTSSPINGPRKLLGEDYFKYMVHCYYTSEQTAQLLTNAADEGHTEVMRDLSKALTDSLHSAVRTMQKCICGCWPNERYFLRRLKISGPWDKDSCQYHEHRESGPCYRIKYGYSHDEWQWDSSPWPDWNDQNDSNSWDNENTCKNEDVNDWNNNE